MRIVTKLPGHFLPAIKEACSAKQWPFERAHFSLDDEHAAEVDAGEAFIKLDKADKALLDRDAAAGIITKLLFLAERKHRNNHSDNHYVDLISSARHTIHAGKGGKLFHYYWTKLLSGADSDGNVDTLHEFMDASAGWLAFHGIDQKKSSMLHDLAKKTRGYKAQEDKWKGLMGVLRQDLDNTEVSAKAVEMLDEAAGKKNKTGK